MNHQLDAQWFPKVYKIINKIHQEWGNGILLVWNFEFIIKLKMMLKFVSVLKR